MGKREERARELFSNGYNCAQSVLGAFCEDGGLDFISALKLAAGFGGGLRCGEVCGAVTGAVMALGLRYGFYIEKDFEQKNICNAKTYEFIQKFTEAKGSVLCRDLLGADVRKPEDHLLPAARESHQKLCPDIVAAAVRILESMIE